MKELIKSGQSICETNLFFYILRLVLKYILQGINTRGTDVFDLVKHITKTEMDFKVYTIYKDFGMSVYNKKVKFMFYHGDDIDEITYVLINEIKTEYDSNHAILEPFISKAEADLNKISYNYQYMKSIPDQVIETETSLKLCLSLLEKAHKLELEASQLHKQSISILKSLVINPKKEILLLE